MISIECSTAPAKQKAGSLEHPPPGQRAQQQVALNWRPSLASVEFVDGIAGAIAAFGCPAVPETRRSGHRPASLSPSQRIKLWGIDFGFNLAISPFATRVKHQSLPNAIHCIVCFIFWYVSIQYISILICHLGDLNWFKFMLCYPSNIGNGLPCPPPKASGPGA